MTAPPAATPPAPPAAPPPATPAATSMGARVGVRTVVSLMLGRSAFRLAFQAANLALLVSWGSAVFGIYAAALGVCGWLAFLGSAVEKTALKLLPRSRRLVATMVRLCLILAGVPLVACLLALGVAAATEPGSRLTLYLMAATWCATTGLMGVLAALHRLAGHPERDRRAYVALAVAILVSLGVTWAVTLPPVGQLALIDAAALVLVMVLAALLPSTWRHAAANHRRPPILRAVLRTTTMLGTYDLAGALAVTTVYATLAVLGLTDQTSLLYVAVLVSTTAGSVLIYLLRIWQPHTSSRLRGSGARGGRERARRVLVRTGFGGLAIVAVLAAYAAVGHAGRHPGLIEIGVITAGEIILYTMLTYATFLIENTDSAALRITSGSSIAGLASAAALSVPLVSTFGAAGAMAALALAAAVQGVVTSNLLARRYGTAARPARMALRSWQRSYRKAVDSAYATVPYYREWWSETGLGTPTDIDVAERRQPDLVPLRAAPSPPEIISDYGLRGVKHLRVAGTRVTPSQRCDLRHALPAEATPGAVAHHPLLGHLAVFGECGQWHVTYPDFYAREVAGGVAYTALRRRTPRLVDIRLGDHAPAHLGSCPQHLTPTLRP